MKGFVLLVWCCHEYVKGSRSSHMCVCMGNVCSLRARGLSRRNTTKSFWFDTIQLDALLHKLTVLAHINTTSELSELIDC